MQVWVITSQDGVEQQRGWLGAHDGIMIDRKQATSFATTAAAIRALAALEEAVSSIGEAVDWTFMVPDDGNHPYDHDEPTFVVRVTGPAGGGWVHSQDPDGAFSTGGPEAAMKIPASQLKAFITDLAEADCHVNFIAMGE